MDQLDLLGLHRFGPDLNRRFAHSRFEQAVPLLFTQSALHCTVMTLSLSLSLVQTPLSSRSLDTLPSALMVVNLKRVETANFNNVWPQSGV